MPHFHLNLVGDEAGGDNQSLELPDLTAAIDYAILGGRQVVADLIVSGKIVRLSDRIEVMDADGVVQYVVLFADIIRFVD